MVQAHLEAHRAEVLCNGLPLFFFLCLSGFWRVRYVIRKIKSGLQVIKNGYK
nr:MAG TPA: hypothetical protein [Caudoviricetes sp.]